MGVICALRERPIYRARGEPATPTLVERSAVLLLSASTGSGHVRAARALERALKDRDPDARVEHVDVLDLAPAWVRTAYGEGFELLATRAGWAWRALYRLADGPGSDRARWAPLARRLLFRKLGYLLSAVDWRVCVSTHFLPPQLAAGRPGSPPFALVVTDFGPHRYWVQPRVAVTFAPTEEFAAELRRRVPGARVCATGIPISPDFATQPPMAAARRALNLDPRRPAVLVSLGSLGFGVERLTRGALAARTPGLQVLAVCGRNRDACARLRAERLPPERLRVFGYVSDMPRLVAACDAVVGKPGGLTAAETLAVGRALVVTQPIPGHEDDNARVLVAAGAARRVDRPDELAGVLEEIFDTPGLLERLSAEARMAGRPHAARAIATALLPAPEIRRAGQAGRPRSERIARRSRVTRAAA